MACRLVALDKRPGVHPVGIGETLRRALAKLVMMAAGDQLKTACGNLQLCAGLEAGIDGATHDVVQRRLGRARERRLEEEETEVAVEEEEEGEGVVIGLNNLRIETARTAEEATEGLEAALGMATLEMEVEEDRGREGEEEGGGTQRALGALEFLTQEADPSGTTLIDTRNGFNELSRLEMLWTVRHLWPVGSRFAFN